MVYEMKWMLASVIAIVVVFACITAPITTIGTLTGVGDFVGRMLRNMFFLVPIVFFGFVVFGIQYWYPGFARYMSDENQDESNIVDSDDDGKI
jgi:uncharacterized membrane protein